MHNAYSNWSLATYPFFYSSNIIVDIDSNVIQPPSCCTLLSIGHCKLITAHIKVVNELLLGRNTSIVFRRFFGISLIE